MTTIIEQEAKIARYDLPAAMTREIGRIVVRFAYAETYSQGIVYMLTNVPRAIGRLAIREPRLQDRLLLIQDLAAVRGFSISDVSIKDMVKVIDTVKAARDLYAHGSWAYSKKLSAWAVMVTTGRWDQKSEKFGVSGKKKIQPEGVVVSLDSLAQTVADTEGVIQDLRKLQAELEMQERARLEELNEQFAQRDQR